MAGDINERAAGRLISDHFARIQYHKNVTFGMRVCVHVCVPFTLEFVMSELDLTTVFCFESKVLHQKK